MVNPCKKQKMEIGKEHNLTAQKNEFNSDEDYFCYIGPVSNGKSNSNNSKRSSSKTTTILKSNDDCKVQTNTHKIEFLPCKKTKSADNDIGRFNCACKNEKLFGCFVVDKNGNFQLPKSPMPKNILPEEDDEDDESEYESDDDEEQSLAEEEEEEDDDDDDDDIDHLAHEDVNMLRTASTKSLVKVNPLLFSSEFPHKAPTATNFQLGSKEHDKEIKHTHLPRTPFPKTQTNTANNITNIENTKSVHINAEEMHLDIKGSSMLTRRRASSIAQTPRVSILKSAE